MKNNLRKLAVCGLVFSMAAGLLAGCGGSAGGEKESADAASQATAQKGEDNGTTGAGKTITLAASQNWIVDVDRELAAKFEEETGIKVDFQLSPDDQYQTIIKSKLNTGEGPDIFMSYSGTKLKDFNPEQNMADLSNEPWVSSLQQWAIDTSSYNGKLYAQNTAGVDDTNGVLYKKSVFEENNIKVPENYEEFKTACDQLAAAGVTPIYEFVKDLWHTHYWMEGASALALSRDPELYNKLNTNQIGFADVPEFVTAMEQLKEMEEAGYFGENHMSNIYDNSYEAISSGNYGMIIIHGSYPNEMAMNIDGIDPNEYGMFPSPLADNTYATLTAGGTTKCINANSDNIAEAKQYFEFLAREDNLKTLYAQKTTYVSASVEGIEASPTVAYKELMDIVGDKKSPGAEASVYFYDGGKISELCQEMFVGALTPKQVLEEYDANRRAIAKDAGLEGF